LIEVTVEAFVAFGIAGEKVAKIAMSKDLTVLKSFFDEIYNLTAEVLEKEGKMNVL